MENFEINKSKVYIKIDGDNNIISCDGGYSISNIKDFNEWMLIDEGYGDKYNLCQVHYFKGGLYDDNNIPRYKYENSTIILKD